MKRALKEGIDWRAKGVTTPIKSQGPHGVCGTFGQVQSAESQYAIGGGGSNPRKTPRPLTQFSEQQLLSCKPSSGGGEAYEFFHVGLESSADYPFNLSHWPDKDPPPCHLDRSKLLPGSIFTNRTSVPKKAGEEQLAAFIYHNGPMRSASAPMSSKAWRVRALRPSFRDVQQLRSAASTTRLASSASARIRSTAITGSYEIAGDTSGPTTAMSICPAALTAERAGMATAATLWRPERMCTRWASRGITTRCESEGELSERCSFYDLCSKRRTKFRSP